MAGDVRQNNPDSAALPARAGNDAELDGEMAAAPLDAADILASAGEAAYRWDVGSDNLVWSANAAELLLIGNAARISSGRGYAQLIDAEDAQTRFDAVLRSTERDQGHGVFYRVEYRVRPDPGAETKLWIEDCGRWFAGADDKPARAQGTVRVISERHEREQRLRLLARCDELTGEPNRRYLIEILQKTLDDAMRFRSSCGFLLVAIDNLGAHEQIVRLRRRRRSYRDAYKAPAQADAGQRYARPLRQ